jgi:hypothetical protein
MRAPSILIRFDAGRVISGGIGHTWPVLFIKLLLKRGYASVTGSLAVQPFDILYEYALRASRLRVPVSLRVYTLLRRTFMNNAD